MNIVARVDKQFTGLGLGVNQQDPQEFLTKFFELLRNNKGIISYLDYLLTGYEQNTIQCNKCSTCSKTVVQNEILMVPLQEDTSFSESCFIQISYLNGANKYLCGVCNSHEEAKQTLEWIRFPRLLIVQFKRYYFKKETGSVRVDSKIQFGTTLTIDTKSYELIGIIRHQGSLNFGHYYSDVKYGDIW